MPTATKYLGMFHTSDSTWTEGANMASNVPVGNTEPQATKPKTVVRTPAVARRKRRENTDDAEVRFASRNHRHHCAGQTQASNRQRHYIGSDLPVEIPNHQH